MDPLPELTIALSLATLFAAAAIHKLRAWEEWPGLVRNYRLLPEFLAGAAAAALPAAEACVSGALAWPAAQPVGGIAAAALLVAYAAAIGINLGRGRTEIDCGCFGSRLKQGIAPWMVGRNLLLAGLALTLLLPRTPRPLAFTEIAAAAGIAATLGLLYPVLAVVVRPPPPTFEQNYRASVAARAHD